MCFFFSTVHVCVYVRVCVRACVSVLLSPLCAGCVCVLQSAALACSCCWCSLSMIYRGLGSEVASLS